MNVSVSVLPNSLSISCQLWVLIRNTTSDKACSRVSRCASQDTAMPSHPISSVVVNCVGLAPFVLFPQNNGYFRTGVILTGRDA